MLKRFSLPLLVAVGFFTFTASEALAQQSGEADVFAPVESGQAPATQSGQKAVKKAKVLPQKPASTAAAPASGGNDVEQRLQQLEEQISDMQVMVGTMESLGKGRSVGATGVPASLSGGGGDVDVRVGRLEAEMQGLNNQMAELANQMRTLESRLQGGGGVAPLKPQPVPRQSGALPAPQGKGSLASTLGEEPAAADTGAGFGQTVVQGDQSAGQDAVPASGMGANETVTAEPSANLPVDKLRTQPQAAPQDVSNQVASLQPLPDDPQAAYDQAYGLILQQDYSGAETSFHEYVTRFPQSQLASNANYWLGQSYYARGQYKAAADAFLRGYKTYRTGQKAPDSLLKVAMSLSRLGQKDMACSALTALDGEFPTASVQIKHLAQSERERSGC